LADREDINVLKHNLVSTHEILSEEEKRKLLTKLNIIPAQLPKFLSNDAAVKAIGAKVDDIIKITRKSQTAGITTYYRIVIKAGAGKK
jgi:DNA-directed RNA polymerase subunit H